jgi:hypothetical protein
MQFVVHYGDLYLSLTVPAMVALIAICRLKQR